ncbi:DUF378 domain-containing protein [bacterium]|nr:DUF378 domain-containing protein [bacterium]
MKYVKLISYLLVIVGAINWGLVGIFNLDLVAKLFGDMTLLSRTVYTAVDIAAIVSIIAMSIDEDSCL